MKDDYVNSIVNKFLASMNKSACEDDYCSVCQLLCTALEKGEISTECFEDNFNALLDAGLDNPYQVA